MKKQIEILLKSKYLKFIIGLGIIKKIIIILLIIFPLISSGQNYYVYVASESDDTVSLLKFDENEIIEVERIVVGTYPTEIEGPHGITVDPNGKYWYLSLAHGNPFGKLVKYSTENNEVVDGYASEISEYGAFVRIGPMEALLHKSQILDEPINVNLGIKRIEGSSTGKYLEESSYIRSRVVSKAINQNDPRASKIGLNCKMDGLGAYSWIQEQD